MALTLHLGYGRFQLADLQPGECFARYDGTLAKVADLQPPGRPDHILVWNNHQTSNAEQVWLHRTALAYAVSPEQARTIMQRMKEVPMIASLDENRCRSCGGPLQILDASRSQTVTCVECADTYDLPDVSEDECVTDRFPRAVRQVEDGGDA